MEKENRVLNLEIQDDCSERVDSITGCRGKMDSCCADSRNQQRKPIIGEGWTTVNDSNWPNWTSVRAFISQARNEIIKEKVISIRLVTSLFSAARAPR